jgi:hypothetical protein
MFFFLKKRTMINGSAAIASLDIAYHGYLTMPNMSHPEISPFVGFSRSSSCSIFSLDSTNTPVTYRPHLFFLRFYRRFDRSLPGPNTTAYFITWLK